MNVFVAVLLLIPQSIHAANPPKECGVGYSIPCPYRMLGSKDDIMNAAKVVLALTIRSGYVTRKPAYPSYKLASGQARDNLPMGRHEKYIPVVKLGALVRFDQGSITAWVRKREAAGRAGRRLEFELG